MLNSIGLENPGVEVVIEQYIPYLRQFDVPVIVNIAGDTIDDYVELASRLNNVKGVAGIEVNISCPNVKKGGLAFGSDPGSAFEVIKEIRAATGLTLIAKLSPNVTSITKMAESVVRAGADAVSLINTLTGMVIDINKRKPFLANIIGGLSGPAVRPVAVRAVWEVYRAVDVPIIGMGGIVSGQDALEFILAGASAVAVGMANFINPMATIEVLQGIELFMKENNIEDIKELIGAAHV